MIDFEVMLFISGVILLITTVAWVLRSVALRVKPRFEPTPLPDFSQGRPKELYFPEMGTVTRIKDETVHVIRGTITFECSISSYKEVVVATDFNAVSKLQDNPLWHSSLHWKIDVFMRNIDPAHSISIARCKFIAIEGDEISLRVHAAKQRLYDLATDMGACLGIPVRWEDRGDLR